MTRKSQTLLLNRRGFLKGVAAAASTAAVSPWIWAPRRAYAAQTAARGAVKHLLYIRLGGGFRFPAAFNGDVAAEFNPFGKAGNLATGVEWSPSSLLAGNPWGANDDGEALTMLGLRPVSQMANQMMVLPCVDHEPFSASADGNHGSALERFLTGTVGGGTSFLTMVNYGLRNVVAAAAERGETTLPALSFGDAGMARGFGAYAGYRPPVIQGDGFEKFGFDASTALPAWAAGLAEGMDSRLRDNLHPMARSPVDAYIQTREQTKRYAAIFADPVLKVADASNEVVDGISNRELRTLLGTSGTARSVALSLRLFKFGAPAIYLNQGGYDLHSDEEMRLPLEVSELNRVLAGLEVALKKMLHPSGGTYWDYTLVGLGSEFGRTTRGNKFNSARGSDHGGDLATRWMSMPFMGGAVTSGGIGGRSFGRTRPQDLKAEGKVYSYRSVLKTLLDLLGADHAEFFPADDPITDLWG